VPSGSQPRYTLIVARTAARQIAERLPEAVAAAVMNFITGDLLDEPRRVGKPLGQELAGAFAARRGEYRVVYEIDDDAGTVTVLDIDHRRDVYRSR
jgi:mRNA-degrading endonuclease RelE of RelBE toxin-antitoxin system